MKANLSSLRTSRSLILTLLSLARDQIGVWTRQGAGLFTGETPQTARDLPFQGSQNLGSV